MSELSILLLEGSPVDANLVCARLIEAGIPFHCDRVDSKEAFAGALGLKQYDVILGDSSLPDFSGSEAMTLARQQTPDTPFIVVSGVPGEDIAVEMLQRGATDYVLKSKLDRLVPAVRRALSESEEKRKRQAAERAHREIETRYRMLVEAAPQLVWTCTADGSCDFFNSRWVEYTGAPEEQHHGLGWLNSVHPADREAVRWHWLAAIRNVATYSAEYRLRAADGEYRWFQARGLPLVNEAGRVERWFGNSTDIQDQKNAQMELRRQAEALERSNSDLQQFAYIASHDLQEPLRSVISYTQLLKRRYQGKLDADADEFIRYAVEGATRMQKLIQDLLEYSRASVEKAEARGAVPAERAFSTALANLQSTLAETQAEILHDELPSVQANETQLVQVFQNLISNACKYSRAGVRPEVHVSSRISDGHWIFTVRDNGVGFEPAMADRIFGIFQRLHGRDVPGTGMGLAICKRVIESSGGRIWAESNPGHGTIFFFTLPAADA